MQPDPRVTAGGVKLGPAGFSKRSGAGFRVGVQYSSASGLSVSLTFRAADGQRVEGFVLTEADRDHLVGLLNPSLPHPLDGPVPAPSRFKRAMARLALRLFIRPASCLANRLIRWPEFLSTAYFEARLMEDLGQPLSDSAGYPAVLVLRKVIRSAR